MSFRWLEEYMNLQMKLIVIMGCVFIPIIMILLVLVHPDPITITAVFLGSLVVSITIVLEYSKFIREKNDVRT